MEIEYLKHSLEGRTLYERQIISLSKPSMISAKVCVESHVAYHSLEGQPQLIGSFITLSRANCVVPLQLYRVLDAYSFTSLTQLHASMTLTYASMTLTYVLDINVNVRP